MYGNFVFSDGVSVHVRDGSFVCSDRTTYKLVGSVLVGSDGVMSRYCSDEDDALGIIAERHGGFK